MKKERINKCVECGQVLLSTPTKSEKAKGFLIAGASLALLFGFAYLKGQVKDRSDVHLTEQ